MLQFSEPVFQTWLWFVRSGPSGHHRSMCLAVLCQALLGFLEQKGSSLRRFAPWLAPPGLSPVARHRAAVRSALAAGAVVQTRQD